MVIRNRLHTLIALLCALTAFTPLFGRNVVNDGADRVTADRVTDVFNWSDPASLSPAYGAPTAADRYGAYISMTVFTAPGGTTCQIDDSQVAEGSQKARFLYGYNTGVVEMRAYANSDIIVTAPQGMAVESVAFAGAKADGYYMTPYDEHSSFDGQTWATTQPAAQARFYVEATINCTSMTVTCVRTAAVSDITADTADAPARWYTLQGVALPDRPTAPGLYIRRTGNASKIIKLPLR